MEVLKGKILLFDTISNFKEFTEYRERAILMAQ